MADSCPDPKGNLFVFFNFGIKRSFWADSCPDPNGELIFCFYFGIKRSCVRYRSVGHQTLQTYRWRLHNCPCLASCAYDVVGAPWPPLVLYVTQWCFRAVNRRPSGPDFGRTSTGKAPKSAPSRPKAGRRADLLAFPVSVRPTSGPEGRFTARKHYCVT